jgi:hypothetical protein
MSTPKQAAASRANALKSTGPRTPQGRAASRYNALKHGIHAQKEIMFDETAEDLAELSAEYHEHHAPADTDERLLVDTLIHNEWRLRRMRRVEAVLWEQAADAYLAQHPEAEACNSAHAFITNSAQFERLQRMVNGCERNYHRALQQLQRLEVARGHALRTPQTEESKPASESSASFRQNTQTPPPAPPFAGPAAPASPAKTQPRHFPTPDEAMDAAIEALSKESSSNL